MTGPAAAAARAAAAILTPDLGPHLPAEVEAALAARGSRDRPDQYAGLDSPARLIVSIASLASAIYDDRRQQAPGPPRADSLARQVRITLRDQDVFLPPGTDRITELVATEITRQHEPQE